MQSITRFILAVLLSFISSAVSADDMSLLGVGQQPKASSASYQGPGDVVSGATVYVGVRAYNAAYATGSNNALNVRRASDNSTSNIVILSNGNLDIASANTFAGTDATCTGTASGTTSLVLTACSSTPNVADTLTSSGGTGSFTQPVYIVSCGSFTGGAGTCTLNTAQTVTAVSVIAQVALFITEAYDQSGNGYNLLQASAAHQPQLLPSCLNTTVPCIASPNGGQVILVGATNQGSTQPFTFSSVAERIGNTSAFSDAMGCGQPVQFGFSNAVNTGFLYAGLVVSPSGVNDNVAHSIQGVLNGASSSYNADNTITNSNAAGDDCSAAAMSILSYNPASNALTGYMGEAIVYGSGLSTGNQTSLCHSQYNYYNTAASC